MKTFGSKNRAAGTCIFLSQASFFIFNSYDTFLSCISCSDAIPKAYYVNGRQLLGDEEFDLLKEDLSWNGSPLVQMNRNEAKYLAAVQSYLNGNPIMSDTEFDALKATLKEEESQFAVSTEPKCYIDTGICTVTMKEDFFRGNLLYAPVGAILSILWLGFSFEIIEPFIRVNPLLLIALGAPAIYSGTKQIDRKSVV